MAENFSEACSEHVLTQLHFEQLHSLSSKLNHFASTSDAKKTKLRGLSLAIYPGNELIVACSIMHC
jgi:hypothetical protein